MSSLVGFFMELLRIFLTLTRPLSDKVLDFLYRIVMGPPKPLPVIDDEVLLLPAVELAHIIRQRKLMAVDLVWAFIERIKAVEPLINPCIDNRFEEALEEAEAVDKFLDETDKSKEDIARDTPLLGLPFTCKESVGVKGLAMTRGLVNYKDRKAPEDGDATYLFRSAGAIPVTVSNVPMHCMWWESANQAFGMTKNPYDHRRTVGGSSGGEGALIGAAGALFGIGTDLAGGIRIPASFCGIYGHKPSKGVVSNYRPWPRNPRAKGNFMQYVSTGPMCRYAVDLPVLTKIIAGENASKMTLDKKVDFRFVQIYYMEEFPGFLLSATPEITAAVRKATEHFEQEFGCKPMKLRMEELGDAFTIWECKLLETNCLPFISMLSEDEPVNLWMEFLKSLFQCSNYTWPALYFAAVDRRNKDKIYSDCLEKFELLRDKLQSIFTEDAILILPTHPEPPPHYLLTIPKYPNIAYTCIFNILGYPSSQIPAGFCDGLPIGIQAVSAKFNDHLTLAAAVELDTVFSGWKSPCPISICKT